MGFISRKVLPACGNMCVCCPALRPSSRRPVKRYKKLLADIFPKTLDGPPNERQIAKLCEYAARNPVRIPKIAKFLEQRSYKELRTEHINALKVITETYTKLLLICKKQMAYFSSSLLNVINEFLDHKQQETAQILGCQILTRFIYSQADITYARNIESLACRVCKLARDDEEEQKKILRAASVQCLSAMVWFMTEYSYIFADFDEMVHATLQNYKLDEHIEDGNERREPHHNWVDEVVRSEANGVANIGDNVTPNVAMPHPETKDSSTLTREEQESPEVWAHICIQKLAELAMNITTMRIVLDPMFVYFDIGKHWSTVHGLALRVLSDMSHLVKSSGSEQMILAATIRHLDHKNVVNDPRVKANIVQIATHLAQQLRSFAVVAEVGVASDLFRHLRKSLQVTIESVQPQESNWNISLQNSIEDCLLEIAKAIGDAHPLFDMMAITLEKLPATAVVARATIESMLILAHIICMKSVSSHPQLVFPEALLLQLIKTMMHPDVKTRVGAHQIFLLILVRSPIYPRHDYEHTKWQSKSMAAFASAAALFEKLRREKGCLNADKNRNDAIDDMCIKDMGEEVTRNGRVRKTSPYFHKLSSSFIDRTAGSTSPAAAETEIIILNEDEIAQLLSAFWLQANQSDNLPSNFEAIAHSFSLTLLSSRLKNLNHDKTVQFFQLPLSLLNAALNPKGILPPSCQRSLLTLALSMLAFAGKFYHMTELTDALQFWIASNVDPYLRIGDDLQLYIRPQSNLEDFGSSMDQQAAISSLDDLRKMVVESGQGLIDITVRNLSKLTSLGEAELATQLSETFTPEEGPLFGSIPVVHWNSLQSHEDSEESLSFDEEGSRTSSVYGDMISESHAPDLPWFISKNPTEPPFPMVISVGQLLESALHVAGQVAGTSSSTSPLPYSTMASQCEALGLGTRKKLSTWLVNGDDDSVPDDSLPTFTNTIQSVTGKVGAHGTDRESSCDNEQWQAFRLPPASPFDNFMRAAGC